MTSIAANNKRIAKNTMLKIITSIFKNNIIVGTILKINEVLPQKYKKKSLLMLCLLFLNSIFEMIGLAAFLPLFSVILQPEAIQNHPVVGTVYRFIGFESEKHFILLLAGSIIVVIIAKNVMSLLITRSQAKFSLSLYQYFAYRLHQLYYSKGFAFFKNTNSNVILRNINVIPSSFAKQVVLPVFDFLTEIFILVLILTGLMLYNVHSVLLLACTVLPVSILFYRWVKGRALSLEREVNTLTPKLTKDIFQSVHGYVDVEIMNTQDRFRKRIFDKIGRIVQLNVKRTMYNAAPAKVIETGMVLAIFVITVYGLYFLPNRANLGAILGLFALAAYRILPSVNRTMTTLISIKSYQYTFDVISQVNDFKPEGIQKEPVSFTGEIKIRGLSFRFPDSAENVLSNINLTITKGESLGIMGPSGSGKTTLMNLLLGFWQPTEGEIYIDNALLTPNKLEAWRAYTGYVQQDVYIVDASIAENVAFGMYSEEIDFNRLEKVLRQASLWDFIQTLPNHVHTNIGERGAKLSGGQRQRVGIARALYSGADVLFFDEATSALDSQTEMEITESIRSLSDGRLTLVIIAHRQSTLTYCSRIIEIEKGRLRIKEDE
jgi:ABC-type multidrug transport system fused ATPase/permease subunit